MLVAGCASSDFVSSWKAPDAAPLEVSGSKVAAIVMMKDGSSRRAAEDALARELNARGAQGVPLYMVVPNDADAKDEAKVKAALESGGFTGAVTMRPVSKEKEVVSTPVTYVGASYGGFYGGYYPYGWGGAYGGAVVGGDIHTNTVVTVETLVYSLRQNKLVWGGQSKATNPSSVNKLIKDTAAKTARELQRQGLLPTA
ncbi:MAG TPA: hypothetical protein VFO94_00285 [Gammaproteobacteria bacterium]|nr:hypothetical protein [Gammaproteobacteria bacterium]